MDQKAKMIVNGYQAKPRERSAGSERGYQAGGSQNTKPPTSSQLPRNAESTVRLPQAK